MATAIYTHQPQANYSAYHALAPQQHQYPSSSSSSSSSKKMHKESRERGYRLCDQCGAVENPTVARFRLCGGCMTTQYCSQDCQKAHWSAHKAICQHTVAQQTSHSHTPSHYPHNSPIEYEDTVKALRKYTSTHTALLGWAGFQALRLKKVPANIRHSILIVNLARGDAASRRTKSASAFRFHSTQILPLAAYLTDPLILADIARREQRSRASGGVGCLIVVLKVLGAGAEAGAGGEINQVVPVEVDRVEGIQWAERADWENVLREALESGRAFRA